MNDPCLKFIEVGTGKAARRIAVPLAGAFGLVLLPVPAALALGSQPTSLVFHNRYAPKPS